MIELQDLRAGYGRKEVLSDISIAFQPGKVLALLGPNGCGKSTLLRTVLGLQPKMGGIILIDGIPTEQLTPRKMAQKMAYLAQSRTVPNISGRRMVLHGRFPYLSYPRRYRAQDYKMAEKALQWVDAVDLADQSLSEMSGGQRQKIYLAMALAQDTQTVFMDEPTTYLDIGHQLDVMTIARKLADEGRAVVLVLHDLCLALRYADEAALLHEGRLLIKDTPEQIYATGLLDTVFGVHIDRIRTGGGWQYYCEAQVK